MNPAVRLAERPLERIARRQANDALDRRRDAIAFMLCILGQYDIEKWNREVLFEPNGDKARYTGPTRPSFASCSMMSSASVMK